MSLGKSLGGLLSWFVGWLIGWFVCWLIVGRLCLLECLLQLVARNRAEFVSASTFRLFVCLFCCFLFVCCFSSLPWLVAPFFIFMFCCFVFASSVHLTVFELAECLCFSASV